MPPQQRRSMFVVDFLLEMIVVLIVSQIHVSTGFLPQLQQQQRQRDAATFDTTTSISGISEWRNAASDLDNVNPIIPNKENNNRTLCLLPFAKNEALLPGQSTTLLLKEGRFYDMLDDATTNHQSMIGTILLGDDDFLPIMPLCEIVSYEVDAWPRSGITATVTLKCVGRAQLNEPCPPAAASMIQHKPYLKGRVNELSDCQFESTDIPAADQLVDDIEQLLKGSSSSSSISSSSSKGKIRNDGDEPKRENNDNYNKEMVYQQHYWLALAVLGYSPTSLLTSDPFSSNRQKEIEAASWSAFAAFQNSYAYEAIQTTNVMDRLRSAMRVGVQENVLTTTSAITGDDVNNDDTTTTAASKSSPSSSSSSSFFESYRFRIKRRNNVQPVVLQYTRNKI